MRWKHGFSRPPTGFCVSHPQPAFHHFMAHHAQFPKRLGAVAVSFEFNHSQFVEAEAQAKAFFGKAPDQFPEYVDEDPIHGPARGIMLALPISILLWVGIIAGVRALWH